MMNKQSNKMLSPYKQKGCVLDYHAGSNNKVLTLSKHKQADRNSSLADNPPPSQQSPNQGKFQFWKITFIPWVKKTNDVEFCL